MKFFTAIGRSRRAWTILAALAVVAAIAAPFISRRTLSFYTDGLGLREPEGQSRPWLRDVLWERPAPLGDEINLPGSDEYEPRIHPDGDILVFTRGQPLQQRRDNFVEIAGDNAELWIAWKERGRWTNQRPFSEINSPADDMGACFSADGSAVYFYSNRNGGLGGFDLWRSDRNGDGWTEPANLGPAINTAWNELSPAWDPINKRLYFSSDRPQAAPGSQPAAAAAPAPWRGTLRESWRLADYNIYCSAWSDELGSFEETFTLKIINQAGASEGAVAVSPSGDFLYFSSNRPGGEGGFDLYRFRLARNFPSQPENLGRPVNTPGDELDPALAAGGFQLVFAAGRNGHEDLFQATSREVFLARERGEAYWSWTAVRDFLHSWLSGIHPIILALLLTLILCLLYALAFRKRFGKLSLLAQCFLLAILIHLLLAVWMNANRVQHVLMAVFEKDRSQDAYEIGAGGSSEENVGMAIRGALTETGGDAPPQLGGKPAGGRLAAGLQQSSTMAAREEASESLAAAPLDLAALPRAEMSLLAEPSREAPAEAPLVIALEPPAAGETAIPQVAAPRSLPRLAGGEADRAAELLPPAMQRRGPAAAVTDLQAFQPSLQGGANLDGGAASKAPGAFDPEAPSLREIAGASGRGEPGEGPAALDPAGGKAPALPGIEAALPEPGGLAARRPTAPGNGGAPRQAGGHGKPEDGPVLALAGGPRSPVGGSGAPSAAAATAALAPPASAAPGISDAGAISLEKISPPPAFSGDPSGGAAPALPGVEVSPPEPGLAARTRAGAGAGGSRGAAGKGKSEDGPVLALSGGPRLPAAGGGAAGSAGAPSTAELASPARPAASAGDRDLAALAPALEPGRDAGLASRAGLQLPGQPQLPAGGRAGEGESAFVPRLYELRRKSLREEALKAGGGSLKTERAVEKGLAWLAAHQSPDGRWSLKNFTAHLDEADERDLYHRDWQNSERRSSRGGNGNANNGDTAATGLALLAFLGHGDTHREEGPYRRTVERGLNWLLQAQDDDGDLRNGGNLYMHGIAAFAMCEAYAFTRDPELRGPAQKALDFTVQSQNPVLGGWRYQPYPQSGDADTSVYGWMLMALKSARQGGLEIDERCLKRAAYYLETARMSRLGGRFSYQPGSSRTTLAMTAQGLFCQQMIAGLLDLAPEAVERWNRAAEESVRYLLVNLPKASDQDGVNSYYWYYSTLALFQQGGAPWEQWNARLTEVLLGLQVGDEHGTAAGSWDPLDQRAAYGGRVYSTALGILCLEAYYRYSRQAPK